MFSGDIERDRDLKWFNNVYQETTKDFNQAMFREILHATIAQRLEIH